MVTKLDWAGSLGKMWARKADAHDKLLGPIGEAGISALGNIVGKRILDIGCGAGATSISMAKAGAIVTGVDISKDLLAEARDRDVDNLCSFQLCDASTTDFEEPFDLIFSRFGAMFFDDPIAGWKNLRKQLVPDGKAIVVTWREAVQNEWASLPLQAVSSVLGEAQTKPSPSGIPGPFAWAERHVFTDIFEGAGWTVETQNVDGELIMNTPSSEDPVGDAVNFSMMVGPLGSRLKDLSPDVRQAVCNALAGALETKMDGGLIKLSTAGWLITARP